MPKTKNPENLSRFLARLLDRNSKIDYLLAFIIGAWPIGLWYLIDADQVNAEGFLSYWNTPNWTSLALILPLILYALRWIMGKIMPVNPPKLQKNAPPILHVIADEKAKTTLYSKLRRCILSKTNLRIALLLAVTVTVIDMWHVFLRFFTNNHHGILDWTTLYLADNSISRENNILFVIFAYLGQFTATFIGILTIVLLLRHNLFFVRHIYQRRWMNKRKDAHYFQIDIYDVNRCFGFRPANEAFNTQVKALMIAGLAMFISRMAHSLNSVANLPEVTDASFLTSWLPTFSFPAPGQWLMAVFWLLGLVIVAMPAFIKLLPWLRSGGSEHVHLSVDHYLREFFSDSSWPKNKQGEDESPEKVAEIFARNSFWPTGDNRARILFLFSYWIFFIILLPPKSFGFVTLLLTMTLFAIAAYVATLATFSALKWALRYVDDMLVTSKAQSTDDEEKKNEDTLIKSNLGVFISYRRRDSAPYARAIMKNLQEHFHQDNLFMDIDNIEPGVKFGQEIKQALEKVDAVIALIGRDWATLSDDGKNPRIHNPKDMVRYEIATALEQQKIIYPVLVGGATMPHEDELPDPIKELPQFNAVELSDSRWDYDIGILINALKKA